MAAHFRIVGTNLPGATCEGASGAASYQSVHVGVERGREVIDLARGDATEAVFEFDVDVRRGRFSGPYVHGRSGERFVYLSWGELVDGTFTMFRRAKLQLDQLDPTASDGMTVTGTLGLTDSCGNPVCASVRAPRIVWTVG